MKKGKLSPEMKKLDTDIWIILLITFAVFFVYMLMGNQFMAYAKNSDNSVISRLLLSATLQFGIAGFGVTIVCIYRGEKFSTFGLVKRNTVKSVLGTIICFLPTILYIFSSGQFEGYKPLSIMITDDVLQSQFPLNLFGMLLIVLVWGFFEGFNYAVIGEKISNRYPVESNWIDVGALVCAIIGILFHPISVSFWGIIEILTTFIAIYGMLMVRKKTNNAWGCVFAFCFIWNAI
jgi:hypothetical protein